MNRHHRQMAIAFLCVVTARMVFHYLTRFTIDDAFITYRFAENIADGVGFVYNEGERVLGTTTPLFTLLLSSLYGIGLSTGTAAYALSLLASGTTGVILLRFAQALRFTHFSWIPVIAYALMPRSLPAETGGMETALFTMFVTAALFFQYRRRLFYAMGAATLAAATRPEGLLILGLLLLIALFRGFREFLALLALPLALIGPWTLFAWYYFGSIVPNSVIAKIALYSQIAVSGPVDRLVYVMGWHNPLGWALFALALVGLRWLWRKQYFGSVPVVWLLSMVAFYTVSQTHMFLWYVAPIYPIYLLLASGTVPWIAESISLIRSHPVWSSRVAMVVAVVGLAVVNIPSVSYFRGYQQMLESVHREMGYYLRANTDSDTLIAAEDIGYLGYYSGRRILDRDGLVSPRVVPYNRTGDFLGVIRHFRPDWVVATPGLRNSDFIEGTEFLAEYELRKTFAAEPDIEYRVFQRLVR